MAETVQTAVLVDIADDIATLTVNRPDALNALNGEVLAAIHAAVEDVKDRARAILVVGAGKGFVAGADIGEMADLGPGEAAAFSRKGQAAFQALSDFPGPVAAAVHGFALGGGLELALACDFVVAQEGAKLGLPEATLAVVPGFAGSQRLPRRVGPGKAKLMLMTGQVVKADEALRIGLVDQVVPEAPAEEAKDLLQKALRNGPLAVAEAKRLVNEGLDRTLADGQELEAQAFGRAFGTEDQKEGMRAFLEKRKPVYQGR